MPQLSGIVLRAVPARAPKEITLSMTDAGTPDVTLKLTVAATGAVRTGAKVRFQGNGDSFAKSPFSIVITADSAQVIDK